MNSVLSFTNLTLGLKVSGVLSEAPFWKRLNEIWDETNILILCFLCIFFSILSISAFLLLPFCGYDWGPGSWFGISKIVQTTIRDEKKFCAISDSTVEGRALRDEWGAWDWRTDRLFAPSPAPLSSWERATPFHQLVEVGGKDTTFGNCEIIL